MSEDSLSPEVVNDENVSEVSENTAEGENQQLLLDVNVEQRSACERHITVTVAREDIDRFMDKEFDELVPEAQIPGFRPGHAPRKLVQLRFKKEVAERVKSALLMESMSQVNETENLAPISDPVFDYNAVEIPDAGPLVFEYDVEVRPEFEVPNWRGIKIEKPVREFTDADVDEAFQNLRARSGKLEEKDGAAVSGDYIETKLSFLYHGEVINSSEKEVIRLRPQLTFNDATLEDFDKQMEGVKAGESRTLKLKLSDSAPNIPLRGQEVEAVFEVQKVSELILPEVNEEFFKELGFENLDQVLGALRVNLERQLVYQQEQSAREAITSMLLKDADWDLPPALLERQTERELYRNMLELQRSGFAMQDIQAYQNVLLQNSRENTAKLLKEHFILERIAEDEKIDAEDSDYDNEIAQIAYQTQESPRRVRARLEKENRMDVLRNQIIERKVIELIMANADFTETTFEPYPAEVASLNMPAGGESAPQSEEEGSAEESSSEEKDA
ncbi:MAG: trigger factor [Planctomycetia bacterium]|nr:trigger factor [Planctomycetia bacterium]